MKSNKQSNQIAIHHSAKRRKRKPFSIALFVMAMFGVVHLLLFNYLPMFGVVVGFKDMDYVLNLTRGLQTSPWVGFDNFKAFIQDPAFRDIMTNTIVLNVVKLAITFPFPIIFAIALTELRSERVRKTVQTVTYFPYFISWAVYGGIVIGILSNEGLLNSVLQTVGLIDTPISFMTNPRYFWWIIIISDILKSTGWSAVIYVAAISAIDSSIYDAAAIDGANRFQKARFITIPSIMATITVLLLLAIAGILNSNFDQFYILQNSLNRSTSEVIDTFIYRIGLSERRYSYVTAVGLFKSTIALILLVGSNTISKKLSGRGIF